MISDEEREQIRDAIDFVSLVGETVQLRERGSGDFWGCCPFHHEKSPSFHVRADTGFWYCFGCGEGGDVFDYIKKRENLTFYEAMQYLADRAGIELHETSAPTGPTRARLMDCLAAAEKFYTQQLLRTGGPGPDAARSYLSQRGFSSSLCRSWGLGYAPGRNQLVNTLSAQGFSRDEMLAADVAVPRGSGLADRLYERVIFPIHDGSGRTIGLGGRVMDNSKPKYINSKDSLVWHKSRNLFAFDRAKEAIQETGQAIVVEGYTDAISLHAAGITNVCAVLGTALTGEHIKLLSRLKPHSIVIMLDGDEAGQRAAEKTVRFLDKTSAELLSVVLPHNQDPAEYVASEGVDALRQRLAEARPLIDFVMDKHLAGAASMSPGARVRAMDELASLLAPLKDSILVEGYARRVADALGTSSEETLRRIKAAPIEDPDRPSARSPEPVYAAQAAPAPQPAAYRPPTPAQTQTLTVDERMQIKMERELLCLMAECPDAFRESAERIAGFSWTDPRHEAMAWALLATPVGTTPKEAARAAEAVEPAARTLLAGGSLDVLSSGSREQKAQFLLDNLDLFSSKRRIRAIRAKLDIAGQSEDAAALLQEATELQERVNQLQAALVSKYS